MAKVLLGQYRYMVIFKSKSGDKRSWNWEFISDSRLSPVLISEVLEDLCDAWVHKVQEITEWKLPTTAYPITPLKNFYFSFRQKIDGLWSMSSRCFLPRLNSQYDKKVEIETKLKQIFGNDFQIVTYYTDLT